MFCADRPCSEIKCTDGIKLKFRITFIYKVTDAYLQTAPFLKSLTLKVGGDRVMKCTNYIHIGCILLHK